MTVTMREGKRVESFERRESLLFATRDVGGANPPNDRFPSPGLPTRSPSRRGALHRDQAEGGSTCA
jgi:hypothetical protein